MSIVRRLSLLPVILLLLTLGCAEKSEEQGKEKPHVRGIITDFEEERGQVLIENKEDHSVDSGPIWVSLSKDANSSSKKRLSPSLWVKHSLVEVQKYGSMELLINLTLPKPKL